jgi:hypothetical protein
MTTALNGSRPRTGRPLMGAGIAVLAMALTACSEVESKKSEEYQPATVSTADPSGGPRVKFTREAARRIALTTSTVSGTDRALGVEYAALIYDKQGMTWLYTVQEALTFQRVKVVVARIEGNRVILSDGPPPGTRVVTQGVTQVYGAELGMAGKH